MAGVGPSGCPEFCRYHGRKNATKVDEDLATVTEDLIGTCLQEADSYQCYARFNLAWYSVEDYNGRSEGKTKVFRKKGRQRNWEKRTQ